ncbi:MAG: hypothetical protein WCJ09_10160 [Planctomycetota bacterium]
MNALRCRIRQVYRRVQQNSVAAVILTVAMLMASPINAQPPISQPVDLATELSGARRVFVPAEDLDVVMERDHRGAILSRKKFDELLELAKANAAKGNLPAVPVVLTSADYQARVSGDQLLLTVTAQLTQFTDQWQALTFPMQRLAVEKASLDDAPAMLGRNPDGSISLLSEEKGTHTLKLELSTELNSLGSDQVAGFSLLKAPSGTLSLTLPAGKRLLVGTAQLERPAPLEQAADYKIAIGGASGLQLRITDRAADNAADALTFASTGYGLHVAPGEVTWHALTTLQVFGKPIDRLTFSVPSTLEIADVESTGLEGWELNDDPNDKSITKISLSFGQAFDGSRKVTLKGVMAVESDKPWAVPPLSIANVTSHIGQVLVQHPAGVRLRIEETEGVRRSTHEQKPTTDMPDEMAKLNATEFLRFDVWRPDFLLRLTTQPKQREVQTAIAAVLDVNATGLDLQALITVETHFSSLFELDVRLPADWTVLGAKRDNAPLKWQVLPQDANVNQVRILLSPALAAEASGTIHLSLRKEVEGWPVEAQPISVLLPELFLPQSSLNEGTFVIRGDDDLDLATQELTGLDTAPLKAEYERLRFSTQDTRYGGTLKITRKPSRISVQTTTFSRLDPQTMHAFIHAMVEVQGGGIRTLKIALPEAAGTSLRFQSYLRQIVEQKPGAVQNGERIWTLQFDQRVRGVLPLWCDIELPRGAEKSFQVPQARFVDAERQNGFQAVEAGSEQRLTIDAKAADGSALAEVDPLDLPEIQYGPKERIVAVYQNVTGGAKLTLSEERFDKSPVPTAICPLLDITSVLGRTGELQHRANFQLVAVGVQGLRVTLPTDTVLWATLVDGHPVEVRRQGDIYLIPLNAVATVAPSAAEPHAGHRRQLQLFYRSEVPALTRFGTLEQPPPELSVQTGQGTSQPVDVLDQQWKLHYPNTTLLVHSNGALEPEQRMDETGLLSSWNAGIRVPSLTDLGWQAFWVIVTLGAISLFVLSYRKGKLLPLVGVLGVGGLGFLFLSMLFLGQERSNSSYYAESAKVAAPMSAAAGPGRGIQLHDAAPLADEPAAPMATVESKPTAEPFEDKAGEKREDSKRMPELAKQQWLDLHGKAENEKLEKKTEESAPNQAEWKSLQSRPRKSERREQPQSGKEESYWKQLDDIDGMAVADAEIEDRKDPGRPVVAANKGAGAPQTRMALLSLAIDLTPPDGSLLKSFRYAGADPARGDISLRLDYVDEHAGKVARIFLVVLVALAGWFLRRASLATKLTFAAIGLTLPLALLPLVPYALQVVLDGVFFGSIVASGLWLLTPIVRCLEKCCANCCCWTTTQTPSTGSSTAAGLLIAAMLLSGEASAQQKSPSEQANKSAQQAAQPAPNNSQPPIPPVKQETTLVVPFDAGTDPLASEKIILPFDKFAELYHRAYPDKPIKGTAPNDGGIVDALYSVKITPNEKTPDESNAEVTARYAVRSYVDGQLQLELPVGAVAVRSAKLDGKTAPLVVNGACSKVVISSPGLHIVDFEFSVPARLSGSTGTLTLPLLPVPSGKLSFALPAKDLSVRINGSSTVFRRVTQGESQTIEIPVDKGGDLAFAWQPEQAKGAAAAVVHVDSVQAITVTDSGVRASTGFQYRVRQGGIADVTLSLPAAFRLQAVNGADVGGWELQGEGDARKLRVIFRRNVNDVTQMTVEAFLDAKIGTESTLVEIPQLAPQEVTNEIGQVAVFVGNQFSVRAEMVESLNQIDAANFSTTVPVSRPNVAPQLSYRFSKRPFSLGLRVTRQESQANVTAQQAAFVAQRKQQLTTRLVYNLTGAPRSSFNVAVPPGFIVLDVQATGLHDWSLGSDKTTLTIDLKAPRLGIAEVVLSGSIARENDATSAELTFPRPLDATKLQTSAAVWLDDGFAGTLNTFEGWRSVDAAQVSPELKAVRPSRPVQFGFHSNAAVPGAIRVDLQKATPRLAANGLVMVSVTDVAVVHTLALQWNIDSATTDTLVFTTPSYLAGKLEFNGDGIRETTHVDAGNDRTRWTIRLRTPVSGRYFAAAIGTLPPPTKEVDAPAIVFERGSGAGATDAIEGQRQYVLLINTSQSQLTSVAPDGFESVQREDVPVVVDQSLVDQATELVKVKQLLTAPRWSIQKFVQTASAPASVNVADLTTILSRDGTYRGQAIYTIKNHSRQFLALKFPTGAELMSVLVGNAPSRAVTTKRNNETIQLIALPKTSAASLSFPVRVLWRGRLDASLPKSARVLRQEVDFPAPVVVSQQDDPDFGIPVAKTRWTVWLPDDLDVQPLKTSARHNLTLQPSDQKDLLYEKAAVQELSELLGFVSSNYSGASDRARAANNMKQLGMALDNAKQLEQAVKSTGGDDDFNRQRDQAQRRLVELQKTIQEDQTRQQMAQSQSAAIPRYRFNGGANFGNSDGGISYINQSNGGNGLDVTFSNSAALIQGNGVQGIQIQNADESNGDGVALNFELQNQDIVSKDVGAAEKPMAEGKSSGKGANQATRQMLRANNDANQIVLNDAVNQQKLSNQTTNVTGGNPYGGFGVGGGGVGSGQPVVVNVGPGGGPYVVSQWDESGRPGNFNGQPGVAGVPLMTSGTPIGLSGPPHLPNGGPASLQSHTTRNRTQPTIPTPDSNSPFGFRGSAQNFNGPGSGINPIVSGGQPSDQNGLPGIQNQFNGLAVNGTTSTQMLQEQLAQQVEGQQQQQKRGLLQGQGGGLGLVAQQGRGEVRNAGGLVGGQPRWSQSGGLSLDFQLPTTGKKLVFSKVGGDPKLALAVRPQESIRWGLNLVWSVIWLAIGLAVILAVRSPSITKRLSREIPIAAAVLSGLGFFILPGTLGGLAFVAFVTASVVVAWIHRNPAVSQ